MIWIIPEHRTAEKSVLLSQTENSPSRKGSVERSL